MFDFDLYTICAIAVSFFILFIAILAQGKLRYLLISFVFVLDAASILVLSTIGVQGLHIAWILLSPFVLAFFALLFSLQSHGTPRVFMTSLGVALFLLPLSFELCFVLPEVLNNWHSAKDGDLGLAKTTIAFAVIAFVAASTLLAFAAAFISFALELWSQRKGK